MDAVITRRDRVIAIPLLESSGGTPLVSPTVGHPSLKLQTNGRIDPRSSDQWSIVENYQIVGRFISNASYKKARILADIIKSGQGSAGTLQIPKDTYDDDISVVPLAEQEEALTITYPPGQRDFVEVDLGLTRVNTVNGSGAPYNSPTGSGSGPIQITDGTTTIDLTTDIEVERSVGRPASTVRRQTGTYPNATEKRKSAYDAFALTLEFVENATSKINDLVDMFSTRLGRGTLTLKFNGIYGLGSFDVIPQGSNALRRVEPAAQTGVELVPQLNLRVVDNDD